MSPLGFLLLSQADNNLRISLDNIDLLLQTIGQDQAAAYIVARWLGLEIVSFNLN